jgi:hypothetical protein
MSIRFDPSLGIKMHPSDRFFGGNAAWHLTIGPRVAIQKRGQKSSRIGISFGC